MRRRASWSYDDTGIVGSAFTITGAADAGPWLHLVCRGGRDARRQRAHLLEQCNELHAHGLMASEKERRGLAG